MLSNIYVSGRKANSDLVRRSEVGRKNSQPNWHIRPVGSQRFKEGRSFIAALLRALNLQLVSPSDHQTLLIGVSCSSTCVK
jgi:hypothetical protein